MDRDEQVGKVRAVFDAWAAGGRAENMETGHGPSARPAFDRLGLTPGSRYLDVGCGNGYTVRWAADLGCEAWGLDASPGMIARAVALSADHAGAHFTVSAFPDATFEPASFDAAFSMEVFYYLPDLDAGLRRVRELLRPGARFACVVDFYRENPESHGWPDDLGVAMNLLSEAEWREAFERNGLEVVEQARIRQEQREEGHWKRTVGSLLTLGRRPA